MSQQVEYATRSRVGPVKKSYSLEERNLAATNLLSGKWDGPTAARMIGCSKSAARNWKIQLENNLHMHAGPGRPTYLSPDQKKKIVQTVEIATKKGKSISKRKFGDLIQTASNNTRTEENKDQVTISNRYVHDLMIETGIRDVKAEVIDTAHLKALNDPRHAASHAAMMHYLHKFIPKGLYFNMDKTSYEMDNADQQLVDAVIMGDRGQSLKCEDPYPTTLTGYCAVHVLIVANDSGKIADIVYLVKDKRMKPDALDAYEVPMLDGSTSSGATAWLLFVGESTKNKDSALVWLFHTIVVPFVTRMRARMGKDATTAASLTLDGDPRQLQVIATEDICAAFKNANIVPSKSPASCTPIFQVLDVGKLFLASKRRFSTILRDGTKPEPDAARSLLEIFKQHRRAHPYKHNKNGTPSVEMGNYFTNVQKCLFAVAAALDDTLATAVVKNSFRDAGVSPYDPVLIRSKCKYEWTEEEEAQFLKSVPVLADILARNSELKEKDFDDALIPANNDNKDKLAVHRRRALLLHAPHVLLDLANQAINKENA